MSAGVQPEGFNNFMLDVRDASIHAVHALDEYDQKIMLPALVAAIGAVIRIHVEAGRFESMEHGMEVVFDGLRALVKDHTRDMDGLDNGH